nr:hypothetical protein [Xenorhabdus hominickii]
MLAVLPDVVKEVKAISRSHDLDFITIGGLTEPCSDGTLIEVLNNSMRLFIAEKQS